MSTEEPVSAYGVFKAAKDLSNSNKKNKKKQNGSANSKPTRKRKITKLTSVVASSKATSRLKSSKMSENKKKPCSTKKDGSRRKKPFNADAARKAGKKKNWEEGATQEEESVESFGSQDSEDESSDSDLYSGEYVINESGALLEEESKEEEEFLSTNEDDNDNQAAMSSTADKKRKSSGQYENKTKSSFNLSDTEAKKSKIHQDFKGTLAKSLPVAITDEAITEHSKKSSNLKKRDSKVTIANVKLKPLLPPNDVVKLNSIEEGKRAFKWLLNPVAVEDFFAKYWEQKICLIKRQQDSYFGHLISFESIDQMLIQNHVEFTKNIDVTSYKNGVRETLNPEGRAMAPVVWDHYGQGCSIRLLNPQTFLPALYTLSATMQEYFHCLVGANAYLTPPNSQGFAPHYDDIEAFVLQIEGRKRWKLYKPRRAADILPRFSSQNFKQEEIGKPVLEVVLEPGDVLYFPRGTIHQASTEPGYHSLHITLSVYQKQSYADLFEKMLPMMLQGAIANNLELRRGLPLQIFQHAGITYSDHSTKERAELTKKVTQLMQDCIRKMPLQDIMDASIDQLAKKFQHEALPPEILPAEKLRTVFGSRSRTNESGECVCDYDISERTNVRLLRANILRLVYEENKMRIYYYLDNSKEYCEYEPNFIEIESGEAASVEVLIKYYPQYIGVSQLPLPSDEDKINFATALWERGLLMMEKPFR